VISDPSFRPPPWAGPPPRVWGPGCGARAASHWSCGRRWPPPRRPRPPASASSSRGPPAAARATGPVRPPPPGGRAHRPALRPLRRMCGPFPICCDMDPAFLAFIRCDPGTAPWVGFRGGRRAAGRGTDVAARAPRRGRRRRAGRPLGGPLLPHQRRHRCAANTSAPFVFSINLPPWQGAVVLEGPPTAPPFALAGAAYTTTIATIQWCWRHGVVPGPPTHRMRPASDRCSVLGLIYVGGSDDRSDRTTGPFLHHFSRTRAGVRPRWWCPS